MKLLDLNFSPHRARALCLLAGLGLCLTPQIHAQDEPKEEASGMAAFARLVPLGFVSKDVRVPSFSDDGLLASVMKAQTLIRIDDQQLQVQRCTIKIAGKRPEEEVIVNLPSAIYHMGERLLRSGERCDVSRSDFRVEGDSMVFDADKAIGQMKGHVHTIIFDTDSLSGTGEGAPRSAK